MWASNLRPSNAGEACGRSWKAARRSGTEFVVAEVQGTGRMIRTAGHKYITYAGDPVEQLFDMTADPGETRNLAADAKYAGVFDDHRKLLQQWTAQLDVAPVSLEKEKDLKALRKRKA